VLGIGNNAVDIATTLVDHASKIYLSHRHGVNLVGFLSLDPRLPADDMD
jgi:hypothetical protein